MKIKVINKSRYKLPEYSTDASVGMDLRANLKNDLILRLIGGVMIPKGLFIEILVGSEVQIRSGSRFAIRKGIKVVNSPGTIDVDYRGDVCVIALNLSNDNFVIEGGERICQMIISKHEKAE